MVAGFATHGHSVEAFQVFRNMIVDGFTPDDASLRAILSACNVPECLLKGKEVHGHAIRVYGGTTSINHCLISMYSKCQDVQTARRIFDATQCKDQVMLYSMIFGYSANSYTEEAISLFHLMLTSGFQIDGSVWRMLINY